MELFKFFNKKEKGGGQDNETENKGNGISRREFLKKSKDAAIAAAGAAAGLGFNSKESEASGNFLEGRYPSVKAAKKSMEEIRDKYDRYINTYILNIRHREIPFRTDTEEEFGEIMEKKKYLLKEREARAIIMVESDGDKNKMSNIKPGESIEDVKKKKDEEIDKIAFGAMQIKRKTAEEIEGEEIKRQDLDKLLDPKENIFYGVEYLQKLMFRFKDKNLAFLAYNIGPTEVARNISKYKKAAKNHKYVRMVNEVLEKIV